MIKSWAGPEGTNKLHEVAQSPLVPTPATLPFLFHPALHGEFLRILWQKKEKIQTCFMDDFSRICRHHPKVDSCSITALFWDTHEGQQWVEIWASHLIVHLVCKEEQPNRWLYSNLCAVGIGLAGLSGIWKEHNWKINDKEMWGRGLWIDISGCAKNMKTFVSHARAHQWVTSVKEAFNHQVDRMAHAVDTSQPLFPAASVLT